MKGVLIGIAHVPYFLLAVPFIIPGFSIDDLIPYGSAHPFTPLIWPGIVVGTAIAVIIASRAVAEWPARNYTILFNVVVALIASLLTFSGVAFALNPT